MLPYGYIAFKTVSGFAEILKRKDVNARIMTSIRQRSSILRSWWACLRKRCDYYQVYQAYGPADLTHVGYHAAERLALEHLSGCTGSEEGTCRECQGWATRLRGELWAALAGISGPTHTEPLTSKARYGFYQEP